MSVFAQRLFRGSTFAAAMLVASVASAEPPSVSPLMQRAFAALEQGPDQLRWFTYRAGIMHNLSYADVAAAYAAMRTADVRPRVDLPSVAGAVPFRSDASDFARAGAQEASPPSTRPADADPANPSPAARRNGRGG